MQVKYISKDELRSHWGWIKEGLEKVRAKGHDSWIVEDIYCDCFEQRSMLWIGYRDDQPVGFMVLQPIGDALHVWVAYLTTHQDLLDGFKEINKIASNGGAKKVTFTSVRKGWEKKARLMGFTPTTWEYKLDSSN